MRTNALKCQVTVIIRLLAFLSVGFLPLPFNEAFYGNTFRLSDRCIRLLPPFSFCTFLQLRGRSVSSFRHLCLSFNFGLYNHSEK
jgi:hypothetical protein